MPQIELPPGLYHLVYHDVNPEVNEFSRWASATMEPGVFRAQMNELARLGEFRSFSDSGASAGGANEAEVKGPQFVIWFDDGFQGVFDHALPICREFNVKPVVAVNSGFASRSERFWRYELSYLLERVAPDVLAKTVFAEGETAGMTGKKIWWESLQQFDFDLRERVGRCFEKIASGSERESLAAMFMDGERLSHLLDLGWELTNHSETHLGITTRLTLPSISEDFRKGEQWLRELGGQGDVWVVPFDYGEIQTAVDRWRPQLLEQCRCLVRADLARNLAEREIFRISLTDSASVVEQISGGLELRARQDGGTQMASVREVVGRARRSVTRFFGRFISLRK